MADNYISQDLTSVEHKDNYYVPSLKQTVEAGEYASERDIEIAALKKQTGKNNNAFMMGMRNLDEPVSLTLFDGYMERKAKEQGLPIKSSAWEAAKGFGEGVVKAPARWAGYAATNTLPLIAKTATSLYALSGAAGNVESADKWVREANKGIEAWAKEVQRITGIENASDVENVVGNALGSVWGSVAIGGVFGGEVVAPMFGVSAMQDTYVRQREEGTGIGESLVRGAIHGTGEAALERLQFNRIFGNLAKKSRPISIIKDLLENAVQEGLQQANELGANWNIDNRNLVEKLQEIGVSMVGGAIASLGGSIGGNILNRNTVNEVGDLMKKTGHSEQEIKAVTDSLNKIVDSDELEQAANQVAKDELTTVALTYKEQAQAASDALVVGLEDAIKRNELVDMGGALSGDNTEGMQPLYQLGDIQIDTTKNPNIGMVLYQAEKAGQPMQTLGQVLEWTKGKLNLEQAKKMNTGINAVYNKTYEQLKAFGQDDVLADSNARVRSAMAYTIAKNYDMTPEQADNMLGGIMRQKASEFEGQGQAQYQDDTKDFYATHNIDRGGLTAALKLGGLAMPSFAVRKIGHETSNQFGEITLIGNKKLATPSRSVEVYDRDAWSPSIAQALRYDLKPEGNKFIKDVLKRHGREIEFSTFVYNIAENIKEPTSNSMAMDLYAIDKGLSEERSEHSRLWKDPDYLDWYEKNIFENADPYLWTENDANTDMIRRKFTLQNMMKYLRKQERSGGGWIGDFPDASRLLQYFAYKFPSLKEMKARKENITTREEQYQGIRKLDEEFYSLAEEIKKDGEEYEFYDDKKALAYALVSDTGIKESLERDKMKSDTETIKKVEAFKEKLKNVATDYFEAKPRRIVGLDEFSGAIIPNTKDYDSIAKQLEEKGLDVKRVEKGNAEQHTQALNEIQSEKPNVFFQEDNVYYQIAGANAKTALLDKLDEAKKMESERATRDEIFDKTGWWKGKDGKWRYEIDDKDAKIVDENLSPIINEADVTEKLQKVSEEKNKLYNEYRSLPKGEASKLLPRLAELDKEYNELLNKPLPKSAKLSDVFEFEALYKAYPQLKDINVAVQPTSGNLGYIADYNHSTNTITIYRKEFSSQTDVQKKNTFVHEIQHAIQEIEDFARGGSGEDVLGYLKDRITKIDNSKEMREYLDLAEEVEFYTDLANIVQVTNNPKSLTKKMWWMQNVWSRPSERSKYWKDFLNTKAEEYIKSIREKYSGWGYTEAMFEEELKSDKTYEDFNKERKSLVQKMKRAADKVDFKTKGFAEGIVNEYNKGNYTLQDIYFMNYGEMEAWNVGERSELSEMERMLSRPYETQKYPSEEQNIIINGESKIVVPLSRKKTMRGAFQNNTVYLFENANESTFVHEMAHSYMNVLEQLASNGNAKAQSDLNVIRNWLDKKQGQAFTQADWERFARGFEMYMREGKSPNEYLGGEKGVFARFRDWLMHIYAGIKSIRVKNEKGEEEPVRINNQIRRFYDEMLGGTSIDEVFGAAEKNQQALEVLDNKLKQLAEAQQKLAEEKAKLVREMAENVKPDTTWANVKDWGKNVWESAKELPIGVLQSSYERLAKIDPRLGLLVQRAEQSQGLKLKKWGDEIQPFYEAFNKLSDTDKAKVQFFLLNQQWGEVEDILGKEGTEAVHNMLEEIYNALQDSGVEVGYRDNYFPRAVLDYDGLLQEMGLTYPSLRKEMEKALGKDATPQEQAEWLDKHIMGFRGTVSTNGNRNTKERKLNLITDRMAKYYKPSMETLVDYMNSMAKLLSMREAFGKDIEYKDSTAEDSIGKIINRLFGDNKLTKKEIDEVRDVLSALYLPNGMGNKFLQAMRQYGYATKLSYSTTIRQFADIGMMMKVNGVLNTLDALFHPDKRITLENLGIDPLGEEFQTSKKDIGGKFANFSTKWKGINWADAVMKNAFLRGNYKDLQKLAKTPEKFHQKYDSMFGDEVDTLIKDLNADEITEPVKVLLFHEISKIQPISRSAMPTAYLQNPNGRVFYMFKTFSLHRAEYMVSELADDFRRGDYKKAGKDIMTDVAVIGWEGLVELLITFLKYGWQAFATKEVIDTFAGSGLGVFGLNKHQALQITRGQVGDFFQEMVGVGTPIDDIAYMIRHYEDTDKLLRALMPDLIIEPLILGPKPISNKKKVK